MARAAKQTGKQARRDALVGAAQRAMLEHGADAKLVHVAEAAGLTSGAVLYHFPDVQALLLEANRSGMERFYDQRRAALDQLDDPVAKLVTTVRNGLPTDGNDASVRLLCELGGAAGRQPIYGALLTSLYDRQVAMYEVILAEGVAAGVFTLNQPSRTIARNLVALEDAYGYRIIAGHPNIDQAAAAELILDYARVSTGHPLDPTHP
ncbi:TetR/AcrR family transcriptional regulator [Nocardioides sp. GXZ039]|uniref:TetR/AcrR family transcriptional regulator n=1 Tax=Nocardioides sp. GXZ039 TaxID=3136018 RepID=UPI0030F45140